MDDQKFSCLNGIFAEYMSTHRIPAIFSPMQIVDALNWRLLSTHAGTASYFSTVYNWSSFFSTCSDSTLPNISALYMIEIRNDPDRSKAGVFSKRTSVQKNFDPQERLLPTCPQGLPGVLPSPCLSEQRRAKVRNKYLARRDLMEDGTGFIPSLLEGSPLSSCPLVSSFPSPPDPPAPPTPPPILSPALPSGIPSSEARYPLPIRSIISHDWRYTGSGDPLCDFYVQFDDPNGSKGRVDWAALLSTDGHLLDQHRRYIEEKFHDKWSTAVGPFVPPKKRALAALTPSLPQPPSPPGALYSPRSFAYSNLPPSALGSSREDATEGPPLKRRRVGRPPKNAP